MLHSTLCMRLKTKNKTPSSHKLNFKTARCELVAMQIPKRIRPQFVKVFPNRKLVDSHGTALQRALFRVNYNNTNNLQYNTEVL